MSGMRSLNDDVGREVIDALVALQGSLTEAEMAARIGCERTHWWSLKTGRRNMSYALARKASVAFPQITRILMRDIADVEVAS